MGEIEQEKTEQPEAVSDRKDAEPEEKSAPKKAKKPKDVRISENELAELREKAALADEYFDRLLRLQADFENFRKRKEKERLETIKYATEEFVCELVPILSNFERALTAAEKVPGVKGFTEGIEIILKQMKKLLKERGIEEICPIGSPFDPYRHQAVEQVLTNEHPHGHVLEVLQVGYALSDRVVQPAAVRVAAMPTPASETAENEVASEGQAGEQREAGKEAAIEKSDNEIKEGSTNG